MQNTSSLESDRRSKYVGTFLLAASTLAVEISLIRILSVVTWYYLAFFGISIAMVGMTAGALAVYFRPAWFAGARAAVHLSRASLLFAWSTPLALLTVCFNPLFGSSGSQFWTMLLTAVAWMVPFFASGLAISGVLTRCGLPIGAIYGADLVGAASGCLIVLGGLALADPMSLMLICSATGSVAAWIFLRGTTGAHRESTSAAAAALLLAAAALWNLQAADGIGPRYVKGEHIDPGQVTVERWNTYSQVRMGPLIEGAVQFWGPGSEASPARHENRLYKLVIDGSAATFMQEMRTPADVGNLLYDVTNFGHYLDRRGLACIVGVGGGRDLQSALLFGYPRALGIEMNPVFIDLLTGDYAEFAGLARRPEVSFVVDEARSYLTRSSESCG